MKSLLIAIVLAISLVFIPASVNASDNYTFEEFNLEIEVLPPVIPPSGGGGGGGSSIIPEYTFSTSDGQASITVPTGTTVKNSAGNIVPASSLYSSPYTGTSTPPPGHNIIGAVYQYGPPGVTFSPPISLTLEIPEGTNLEGLKVAYYDETAGEWVILEGVINTENNTITVQVSHFTLFALLFEVPTETPAPAPAPTPSPAPLSTPEPPIPPAPTPGPSAPIPLELTPSPERTAPIVTPKAVDEGGFNWWWVAPLVPVCVGLWLIWRWWNSDYND